MPYSGRGRSRELSAHARASVVQVEWGCTLSTTCPSDIRPPARFYVLDSVTSPKGTTWGYGRHFLFQHQTSGLLQKPRFPHRNVESKSLTWGIRSLEWELEESQVPECQESIWSTSPLEPGMSSLPSQRWMHVYLTRHCWPENQCHTLYGLDLATQISSVNTCASLYWFYYLGVVLMSHAPQMHTQKGHVSGQLQALVVAHDVLFLLGATTGEGLARLISVDGWWMLQALITFNCVYL